MSTDPSPFDDDEVDAGLVHATKHPSRRSDHRLDPAKNLVDDELERAESRPAREEASQERKATLTSHDLPGPVLAEHASCVCLWCER